MEQNIIGRESEINRLKKYIDSNRSEFIAIYGRRRIGKTFLIKELFEGQFAFRVTGMENTDTRGQLKNFYYALKDVTTVDAPQPKDWEEAFRMLQKYLEQLPEGPKVVFIDELSWFDLARSKFMGAFEHFWNNWCNYRHDIKLIVCGSATGWMLKKVINARGGLHNRVTHKILLNPFTLGETERYLQSIGAPYERPEILDCYMAVGGVAYYLSLFDADLSVAQNINQLCFTHGGELTDEFPKLFHSLYKKADRYITVIEALKSKRKGLTREEICAETGLTKNGNLTTLLKELEACEFIRSYVPFKRNKKDKLYQLIDPFSMFHLTFMNDQTHYLKDHWLKVQNSDIYEQWCGYAWEMVCLLHLDQLIHALGIDGSTNVPGCWYYRPTKAVLDDPETDEDMKRKAQIDLLIDRSDKRITVCEMKYHIGEYRIEKQTDDELQKRINTFKTVTKTTKTVVPTYVTPMGIQNNMYSRRVERPVSCMDLFE